MVSLTSLKTAHGHRDLQVKCKDRKNICEVYFGAWLDEDTRILGIIFGMSKAQQYAYSQHF